MQRRILVVKDDYKLSRYIRNGLELAGYKVDLAMGGGAAMTCFCAASYSAVLLDRMLPDLDGLQLLAELRAKDAAVPVIMFSSDCSMDDRIAGLRQGADDYISQPFHISEVVARMEAVWRRSDTAKLEPTTLRYADLELELVTRSVLRGGRPIPLSNREFKILHHLILSPGKIVTRKSLLKEVWGYDFDPATNIVDVHVSRMRTKISRSDAAPLVHSERGIGYILELRRTGR